MDGESKNPGAARPATLALIGERALSFGYFSLVLAKKSNSLAQRVKARL
jgi:hypothetical protein